MRNGDYEILEVGAGPAGSACAASLARSGVRTLLLDRSARRAAGDRVPASRIAGAIVGTCTARKLFTPGVLARVLF